ncbi:MAG TPA: PspC domain-containing protein, partial [Candidatus Limnocylindrales bacterium]
MQVNRRRLYRCDHDRKIAGVASGLAEYLDIDVTLIRILWVVSIFFGGLGLLLYIIMAL